MPKSYIRDPFGGKSNLGKDRGSYGIGTTFENSLGVEMFFHLFSSRENVYNTYFYDKCEELAQEFYDTGVPHPTDIRHEMIKE